MGHTVESAIVGLAPVLTLLATLLYLDSYKLVKLRAVIAVRGFGTALMHGGCTAIFAMISVTLLERARRGTLAALAPGFIVAVLLHSAYNHMYVSPKLGTVIVIVVLPPLLLFVFQRSERSVGNWLQEGFDADTQMLDAIT